MPKFIIIAIIAFVSCTNRTQNAVTSTVDYWVTTPDQSMLLQKQAGLSVTNTSNNFPTIDINSDSGFQTMDGFGYTLTGGSAEVIQNLEPAARKNLLQELFGNGDSSIGINYLRLSIGASDLNDTVFSYDDLPTGPTDTAMQQFSLNPDRAALIPILKEILAINPSIKLLGSPWSPPTWMKDNDSTKGGSLKKEFYRAYALYFVRYIQEMKKEGVTIDAITPQNEPLHPGNNPSLLMPALQQAEFIRNHLGPALRDNNISTKIIVYDHNCDRPDYPITVLNDAGAKAFVDGSAFHMYNGEITAMSKVHDAHPEKNIYFTEQYTAIESAFNTDLQWHFKNLIIGAPRNWAKTVLEWNLANNAQFGPHTDGGCTTCKGALTIDGSSVKRNVAYYIIGHASKFIPTGSIRIASNIPGNLENVAYKTPAGKIVIIVLNNSNNPSTFSLRYAGKLATATLPAGAVGSFVW